MAVNWKFKIANARKIARDHDTLDCLDELERLLVADALKEFEGAELNEANLMAMTEKASAIGPISKKAEASDRKAYMRDYMRKKRAEAKA